MIANTDILIIGGGIIGCALFNKLAQRSAQVILIEQGQLASQTTGDSGGFIRKVTIDPYINELTCISFDDYIDNAESCGFVRTGLTTRVSNEQLATIDKNTWPINYPLTIKRISSESVFIYERAAGHIDPKLTCTNWVRAANALGARHYENMQVVNILVNSDRVWGVRTTQGDIRCKKIILATGYQTLQLLAPLGMKPPLTIKSFQYIIYKAAAKCLDSAYLDLQDGIYVFPLSNGDLLAGYLDKDRLIVGYNFDDNLDYQLAESLHNLLSRRFHCLTQKKYSIKKSVDAFTKDDHGLLGYSSLRGLLWATGWSSGGIKIAPAIAKKMIQILGPVDICSIAPATPTFCGLSAESMDPADKPRDVGLETKCQQTLVDQSPSDTQH